MLEAPSPVNIIQCLGCASAGIWSAALNGDLGRVKYLIQKAADPSQPDSAGYTALVSWEEPPLWVPALWTGMMFAVSLLPLFLLSQQDFCLSIL